MFDIPTYTDTFFGLSVKLWKRSCDSINDNNLSKLIFIKISKKKFSKFTKLFFIICSIIKFSNYYVP
jgi:hypothetical protein